MSQRSPFLQKYYGWIVGGVLSLLFIAFLFFLADTSREDVWRLFLIVVAIQLTAYVIAASLYHSPNERHRSWISVLMENVRSFGIIIIIVLLVRGFAITPYHVDGSSMEPNLHDGERILIDKLTYRFSEPERGDVIVFVPPLRGEGSVMVEGLQCGIRSIVLPLLGGDPEKSCEVESIYVKRIIGAAGDTVRIQQGRVYVTPRGETQEQEVPEHYLLPENRENTCFIPGCNSIQDQNGRVYQVADDSVFVLGDNRTSSTDSRRFTFSENENPYVPYGNIRGKVQYVLWPLSSIRSVQREEVWSDQN